VKNAAFWDTSPCGSCKNRCFGGTYSLHHQGDKNQRDTKSLAVPSNQISYCHTDDAGDRLLRTAGCFKSHTT
jgi:hypothetical protein